MSLIQLANVIRKPPLVNGSNLFQQHDRWLDKAAPGLHVVVGRQFGFDTYLAGNSGNDHRGAMPIAHIVLNDNNGAVALLLRAKAPP